MQKIKIGVLVSGGGTNLQALIDSQKSGELNGSIEVVISDNRDAYALKRAQENGILGIVIDKKKYIDRAEFSVEILNILETMGIEFIVLAGFLSVLSTELVKAYENRIINIHPSLIPSFCGKGFYGERVHKAVIEYGVKVTGATVHFVDEGTDTGSIILQEAVAVLDEDTPKILAEKVLEVEHRLLPRAVKLFCEGRLKLEGRRVLIEKER